MSRTVSTRGNCGATEVTIESVAKAVRELDPDGRLEAINRLFAACEKMTVEELDLVARFAESVRIDALLSKIPKEVSR
jgi:hypothetical protein